MRKFSIILICLILSSCSTNQLVIDKTETKHKLTPTIKYFNKKMNSKKSQLV
jgi:hypothetical protein